LHHSGGKGNIRKKDYDNDITVGIVGRRRVGVLPKEFEGMEITVVRYDGSYAEALYSWLKNEYYLNTVSEETMKRALSGP